MWPEEWFDTITEAEEAGIRRVNQYTDVSPELD